MSSMHMGKLAYDSVSTDVHPLDWSWMGCSLIYITVRIYMLTFDIKPIKKRKRWALTWRRGRMVIATTTPASPS